MLGTPCCDTLAGRPRPPPARAWGGRKPPPPLAKAALAALRRLVTHTPVNETSQAGEWQYSR